jgi:hypothetical protein
MVCKSVFDNKNERKLYKYLKLIWGNIFNIYPQLPFTKIFDINTLDVNRFLNT